VRSTVGSGSTFRAFLPVHAVSTVPPASA
jgi:hypothetical protein